MLLFHRNNCDILNGADLCQNIALVVTEESVTVQTSDSKKKVRNTVNPILQIAALLPLQVIARYGYPEISDCSITVSPNTCFGMIVRQL
jgi:uncharacterized protein involved in propanediol utilization